MGIRRGGDITYHGPGQLVGYPIVQLGNRLGAAEHVRNVEQLVIDALATFGVAARAAAELPRRVGRRRRAEPAQDLRHRGAAQAGPHDARLRPQRPTDMTYLREHIVACGIADRPVTSLAEEGVDVRCATSSTSSPGSPASGGATAPPSARTSPGATARTTCRCSPAAPGPGEPVRLVSRLAAAGVTSGLAIESRKPEWLRPKVHHGPEVLALKRTIRDLGLVTVCEDAGCPNLSECWADGTATFMVLGERCTGRAGSASSTRASPRGPAADEPERVAEAVDRMGLEHAVLTMVARDDLPDGGMAHVAACVEAIRRRRPGTGSRRWSPTPAATRPLDALFAVRPDVLNHNVETVARLQRAVRPSAGYARSLSVLARAKAAGLTTKSG